MKSNQNSTKEETIRDVWDDKNRKWPTIVYVETTNFCNAHCLSCLNDECMRIRGIMDLETFKKIADKVKSGRATGPLADFYTAIRR